MDKLLYTKLRINGDEDDDPSLMMVVMGTERTGIIVKTKKTKQGYRGN